MPFAAKRLDAGGGDPAGRRDAGIVAEREIFGDRLRQDQALRLAILGNQHDPVIERVARARRDRRTSPSILTRPAAIGSAPDIARMSSVRPAPTMPATPNTSPGRTEKLTSAKAPSALVRSLDLDQRRRAGRRRDVREHAVERPADHLLDQRLDRHLRRSRGSRPAGRRAGPATRSAMRAISSRRWLM